jgi:hypothetical protein
MCIGFILVLVGCQKAEEVTLSKYFQALKHKDSETMASMAIEPRTLEFKSYKFVNISEPQITDLKLEEFKLEMEAAEKEKKELASKAQNLNDEKLDLEDELADIGRSPKKAELEKRLEEKIAERKAVEDELKVVFSKISAIKKKTEREKNIIKLSTGVEENYELYKGQNQNTIIDVAITFPDDTIKDYVFVLRKNVLTLDDKEINGRFIIVKIQTKEEFTANK